MKVLHATEATQGRRASDFNFCVEGELVVVPAMRCTGERPDDGCGCARALAGVTSHRGTTTAVVADVEMSGDEWRSAVAAAYVADGWFASEAEVDEPLMAENSCLRAAAARLPVGTVVEFRGGIVLPRDLPASY